MLVLAELQELLQAERLAAGNFAGNFAEAAGLAGCVPAAEQDIRPAVADPLTFFQEAGLYLQRYRWRISLHLSGPPRILSGGVPRCRAVFLSLRISPLDLPVLSKQQHCATLCAPEGCCFCHDNALLLQV